jgi:hypothetical protein
LPATWDGEEVADVFGQYGIDEGADSPSSGKYVGEAEAASEKLFGVFLRHTGLVWREEGRLEKCDGLATSNGGGE